MISPKIVSFMMLFALAAGALLMGCTPQATPQAPNELVAVATATPASQNILNIFNPESPDTFNIHLSRGVKNLELARIVYEPLAVFNKDGQLVPVLAAEIPSLENGGLAADGKSITWKLRKDVRWSDGVAFTAADVVFTYAYITDPEVKAGTLPTYAQIAQMDAVDDFTVKITFKDVNTAWALPFVGNAGVIIPQHVFEKYKGANAREAPANTMPVGTGPYIVKEPGIKPQEVLLLGSQIVKTTKTVFEPNPYYRFLDKIFFQRIVWRGGGTVDEAARLLLQEGSMEVVYGLDSANPTKLADLTKNSNKGKAISAFGSGVLRILLNRTDPNIASADGEYSNIQVPHPLMSDKRFRQAIAYAIHRDAIAQLFGINGQPTFDNLIAPPQYKSSSIFYEYSLEKATSMLDEAGYIDVNGDGLREKDGVNLKLVFQALPDVTIQQAQKIIQQDLKTIGVDTDLKSTDGSILSGPGAANPDSAFRFNADMMMLLIRSQSPDPSGYMGYWACASRPQKANNWAGLNFERWCNKDYDALLQQTKTEIDPTKRADMFIKLNDMLVEDVVMIPVVWRASALGISQKLTGLDPTPWDSITWNIQDWRFTAP